MSTQSERVCRSRVLTVEDRGAVRLSSGKVLHKWHVRLEDGTAGTCWAADADDEGKPLGCPFTEGKMSAYTLKHEDGKELKVRPIDMQELDRQRLITRQACLNTAGMLIGNGCGPATVENIIGLAEQLEQWVIEP